MVSAKFPGINIQYPWSTALLEKRKCIETRKYPLPRKFQNEFLWLIETPGKIGNFKARIVGMIKFSACKEYLCEDEFNSDLKYHLVENSSEYRWNKKFRKFGWIVEDICKVESFQAPHPRGIIYCRPFSREECTK